MLHIDRNAQAYLAVSVRPSRKAESMQVKTVIIATAGTGLFGASNLTIKNFVHRANLTPNAIFESLARQRVRSARKRSGHADGRGIFGVHHRCAGPTAKKAGSFGGAGRRASATAAAPAARSAPPAPRAIARPSSPPQRSVSRPAAPERTVTRPRPRQRSVSPPTAPSVA
jgi:hypothetical protein